jgi:hypothetical protein
MASNSKLFIFLFSSLALIAFLQLFSNEQTSTDAQWVDGTASGTILANLWGRKKRQLLYGYADGSASGSILGRKKRQLLYGYADGSASGSILGRKKRQLLYGYADGMTSGSIFNYLWGRRKRNADGLTSGTNLDNAN